MPVATAQPQLLSQLNERSVLRILQSNGPCSRAEVTRRLGVSAPTVSKAVASLLKSGLLEEIDAIESGRGRPAKRLRLATQTARVLGLVIDADQCRLVAADLEGRLVPRSEIQFPTPRTYDRLVRSVAERVEQFIQQRDSDGVQTLGLGVSMPGLIDSRSGAGLLSPNVPITNGRTPGRDLSAQLGLPTSLLQECHALCLAERYYGDARDLDDFAMLDATTGVGLAVISSRRLMTGSTGLAGELGHLPREADGPRCGCGRTGCLETLASDTALARRVSLRLGRSVTIDEIISLAERQEIDIRQDLAEVIGHLAFALATVINLFNPSTLFVFSRMFQLEASVFNKLVDQVGELALKPSFDSCQIQPARGSKREGAIAGIIEHLTDSRVRAGQMMPHQGPSWELLS